MDFEAILAQVTKDDKKFSNKKKKDFGIPTYSPNRHYLDLASNNYFLALIYLRDIIKLTTDYYFRNILGAKNVDLFMLTPSVSSPMGPGSDSEAINIKFGKLVTNLVDSSQFGFEPLLLNDVDKVYCYMPSMRGENPDKRHLNQFFHCEAEIKGDIFAIKKVATDYIKLICKACLRAKNIINLISTDPDKTRLMLTGVISQPSFLDISFDEAIKLLESSGNKKMIRYKKYGRDISAEGEIALFNLLGVNRPIWLNNFDRDRVPFYQKPDPKNEDKVINADFLVPPLTRNAFGGELIGSGQRQDNSREMKESLIRQGVEIGPYKWYINLREQPGYQITSGFGMGVERFIAWILGLSDIKDTILYPRLKNIKMYP
jgi:asparaginyl-tRNA synthetase